MSTARTYPRFEGHKRPNLIPAKRCNALTAEAQLVPWRSFAAAIAQRPYSRPHAPSGLPWCWRDHHRDDAAGGPGRHGTEPRAGCQRRCDGGRWGVDPVGAAPSGLAAATPGRQGQPPAPTGRLAAQNGWPVGRPLRRVGANAVASVPSGPAGAEQPAHDRAVGGGDACPRGVPGGAAAERRSVHAPPSPSGRYEGQHRRNHPFLATGREPGPGPGSRHHDRRPNLHLA